MASPNDTVWYLPPSRQRARCLTGPISSGIFRMWSGDIERETKWHSALTLRNFERISGAIGATESTEYFVATEAIHSPSTTVTAPDARGAERRASSLRDSKDIRRQLPRAGAPRKGGARVDGKPNDDSHGRGA